MTSFNRKSASPFIARVFKSAIALVGTFALMSTTAFAQCNCANATLVGTQVGTLLNNHFQGPTMTTVGSGIELPNAGPTLGAAGSAPRWNINIGANTIRIDFLQQVATYGAGSKFTFSSLNPITSAGCGPAKVVGISVTTNRPGANAYVVAAASFTPNSVILPFAGTAAENWNPGEYIQANLQFGCNPPTGGTASTCCPPASHAQLASMFDDNFSNGNPSYNEQLQIVPATTFANGLAAYLTYLKFVCPQVAGLKVEFFTGPVTAGNPAGPLTGANATTPVATFSSTSWGGGAVAAFNAALAPLNSMPRTPLQYYRTSMKITAVNSAGAVVNCGFDATACATGDTYAFAHGSTARMMPGATPGASGANPSSSVTRTE